MNLIRLIAVALAVWIIILIAKQLFARPARRVQPAARNASLPKDMVRCAHCGLHIPEVEAVTQQDRHYCSQHHLSLGPRD